MTAYTQNLLENARHLVVLGEDEAAKRVYINLLRFDPVHEAALIELGTLAQASGHISAARTAWSQALRYHPRSARAHVGLATLATDPREALPHYQAALDLDPDNPIAHQGIARLLGDGPTAATHWRKGFEGQAVMVRRYRGQGQGIRLLLLVCARGGNIATAPWIDDRIYAVTAIHADFFDPATPPPPHDLIVNAIGDADLCDAALASAEKIAAMSEAPVINHPAQVRSTGRLAIAKRLQRIDDVTIPATRLMPRGDIAREPNLAFPLLLRAPGYHTGQHFLLVRDPDALSSAIAALPGDDLLVVDFHDLRCHNGLVRKYRVMFIDGTLYPLHLAISSDWKVHYFSAAMAANPFYREEEARFLAHMPTVLGHRGMNALARIQAELSLDYAGVDCTLAHDGSLLVFEANATMAIVPPDADPIWDYRRPAIAAAQEAARGMLARRCVKPLLTGAPLRPQDDDQNHHRSEFDDQRGVRGGAEMS